MSSSLKTMPRSLPDAPSNQAKASIICFAAPTMPFEICNIVG
jgi:hypothetical protein